uniref:Chemokine interleukin-8-like domain-containing protein n=1 Tax=Pundamilia nyererei TaxID=303518 RepID=A0A3B4GBE4_9CICH
MSVKILSITLLLLSICSAEVVGETYRQQAARPPCVKAIIFNTGNGGQLCADPNAQWVKDLTANKTKV